MTGVMSRKQLTYIHIFIWLFAIFANLPYSDMMQGMPPRQIVSSIIAFLYLMVVFYLFYLVLVPLFLDKKKFGEFFGFSFLLVLIMPFFGYTLLFLSRAFFDGTFDNFYKGYSLKTHMSGYFPVLTAAVFGSFFRAIINWYSTMNQKAELDRKKLAMELDLLKSKLNPHFLFNTLNNIDSLIHKNPEEASAALLRLSDIMRYLTYETSSEYVELKRETDHINNLVELHRLRVKSPDQIRFNASGDQYVMIAPALFIPLIENAFKYAVFKAGNPSAGIDLVSEKGIVRFEIFNYFEEYSVNSSTGTSGSGLVNLRKRLELTYPGKYELIIDKGELTFKVTLIIDTNAD
jgi:two-component system LytT family sensor kinase